jgi:hypothetical protein
MAGYENSTGVIFGTIFTGSVVQWRIGRENPTDIYLDVYAAAGDIPRNWAVMRQTLAAGYKPTDEQKVIVNAFAAQGLKVGSVVNNLPDTESSRGRSFYGMARDHLDDFCKTYGLSAYINGATGMLEIVSNTGYAPSTPVELNSLSGLIGMPQQTQDGVTVRCLLRPSIMHNRVVHINNKSVQTAIIGTNVGPDAFTNFQQLPSIAADGYYRVLAVDHTGDTRGNPWYTDMWCAALKGQFPLGVVDLDLPAEWNDPSGAQPPPLPVPPITSTGG